MKTAKFKSIIGRAEAILFDIQDSNAALVPAKVDTGAYSSSVWASNIKEKNGLLSFVLFDKDFIDYTGQVITVKKFAKVKVKNSFGESEQRYCVDLRVSFCGKKFTSVFTLADRSKNLYPVLIGRRLLKGRFLVDVANGHPIAEEDTEVNLGVEGLKSRIRKKVKSR